MKYLGLGFIMGFSNTPCFWMALLPTSPHLPASHGRQPCSLCSTSIACFLLPFPAHGFISISMTYITAITPTIIYKHYKRAIPLRENFRRGTIYLHYSRQVFFFFPVAIHLDSKFHAMCFSF